MIWGHLVGEGNVMRLRPVRAGSGRSATAAVELAVLLPFLAFTAVISVDFARAFRQYLIVTNCARNGAVYGSYSPAQSTDKAGIKAAALADAGDLPATTNADSSTGTDADGYSYVRVTVT